MPTSRFLFLEIDMLRLAPEEIKELKAHRLLYLRWGYRTGHRWRHQLFEEMISGLSCYAYLSQYSDVLFRNLQQVDVYNADSLYEGDTRCKFSTAARAEQPDKSIVREASRVVQVFISDECVCREMHALASADAEGKTKAFCFVKLAAQALIAISRQRYIEAECIASHASAD